MARMVIALVALAMATPAAGKTYRAHFVEAHDADTFRIDRMAFDDQMQIRLDGVNAPELGSAKCPEEKAMAERARDFMNALGHASSLVIIPGPTKDKYGGRWRSKKLRFIIEGRPLDPSEALIAAGLAIEYHGEARDPMYWCNALREKARTPESAQTG